jgi:hypothetical protein
LPGRLKLAWKSVFVVLWQERQLLAVSNGCTLPNPDAEPGLVESLHAAASARAAQAAADTQGLEFIEPFTVEVTRHFEIDIRRLLTGS